MDSFPINELDDDDDLDLGTLDEDLTEVDLDDEEVDLDEDLAVADDDLLDDDAFDTALDEDF